MGKSPYGKIVSLKDIALLKGGRLVKALESLSSAGVQYDATLLRQLFNKPLKARDAMIKFPKPTRPARRRHKHSGRKCQGVTTGQSYPSLIERDYHEYLFLREKVREITDIAYQPSVTLVGGIKYKADFKYTELGGRKRTIWVDTKGLISDRFRLVMKLWKVSAPGPLHVVKRKGSDDMRFYVYREVIPEEIISSR